MVVRNYSVKRVFVDREEELGQLKEIFNKVQSGNGQVVIINGEHGIGKSRIVEEFKKYVESISAKFLNSRCKRAIGREPYEPFNEALNINLPTSEDKRYPNGELEPESEQQFNTDIGNPSEIENPGEIDFNNINDVRLNSNRSDSMLDTKPLGLIPFTEPAEKEPVPEEKYTPPAPEPALGEPLPMGLIPAAFRTTEVGEIRKGRRNIYDVITNKLFKLTISSPVVLFIDDIHWASVASFEFLEYLTEQIIKKPVMLLFTISTDELSKVTEKNQKISEIIQNLKDLDFFTEIKLERFDMENANSMIKKIFSRQDVPESFIEQIYRKTEGNPLFIEDVIRALIDEDVIDVSSYVWQTRVDVSQIRIPDSTREVLITRLGRLDKNVLKILGYAAVIGREFSFNLLKELTEISDEALLDAVDVLLEAKLIQEDLSSETDRYRFNNPIIQELAYNELSRSRRRFLHTKSGTILEQRNINDVGKVVFNLADHFSKGRNYEKALKYLILAGDRATQIYAIDDARRYYLSALEILTKFDYTIPIQQREIELLSNLGYTCKMLGDWDQALEYYRNIPQLISNLKSKFSTTDKVKRKEIELISKNWIQLKLADTYWNLAELMRFRSDWENSEKNYKKSLIMSQDIDDYHGIAQAERGRGDIFWRQGDYRKALDHYDICIDFATKINDLPVIAVTYIDIGNIYNYTGELDQAIAYYKESIEHLEKIGWLHEMGRAYNGLGEVYIKQENWSEALENFEKCEEISNKIGDSYKRGWALFNAAECYANTNELEKAIDNCNLAEEILTRLDDRVGLGMVYRNFGIIHHYKEEWEQSKEYFNKSIKMLKQLQVPFEFGNTHLSFGLMLRAKGDEEEAQKCFNYALEVFKDMDAKIKVQEVEEILETKKSKTKPTKAEN